MGCDYYINRFLRMEHPGGVSFVELPRIRGYFCECDWGINDSDVEDDDKYYHDPVYTDSDVEDDDKYYHDPVYTELHRPEILIYTNQSFLSERFRIKYLPLIEIRLQKNRDRQLKSPDTDFHLLMDMKDIVRISKFEVRYEVGQCPDNYYLYFEEDDHDNESEEEKEDESIS